MQNPATDETSAGLSGGAHLVSAPPENAAPGSASAVVDRNAEEMRVLLMGFGTGMVIAAVFLVYIVLSIAHWL